MIESEHISESAYKTLQFRRKIALAVTSVFTMLYIYDIFVLLNSKTNPYGAGTIIAFLSLPLIKVYIASVANYFDILKEIKTFHQYSALIFVQNITSIEQIASLTSSGFTEVYSRLKAMIEKGLFVDVFIDMQKNSIFFGNIAPAEKDTNSPTKDNIICKNCGGSNSKSNKVCEYCGSPL